MLEKVSVMDFSNASMEVKMPTKAVIPIPIIPAVREVRRRLPPTAFRAILRLSVHPREVVAVLIIETMFHGPNIGPARPLSLISPTHKL
jgi:hypothetical protein